MSLSSKPINPNTYTLDIESTHLYFKEFFTAKFDEQGRFVLPDIEKVAEAYKASVPLQFGVDRGDGKIKHIALTDAHTLFMPKEIAQAGPMDFVSHDGKRTIRGVMSKTQYHTQEELFNYLSATGSKLSDRKLQWYMDKVAWHYLGKDAATTITTIDKNGNRLNSSKFSFEKFILNNTPEGIRKAVVEKGVHYHTMDFNKFISGSEADSLAELVGDMIKKGSIGAPAEIKAWNAPFDINYIRSVLFNNGNKKLQVAFDDAVRSGTIAVNSVEKDWQLIAYNLLKDDPGAMAKVTIGYSPAAARETGRVGQAVNTFEEFKHSTVSWSQDKVSSYMKWYGKVQDLGVQTHFAGPDVKLTNVLSEAFGEIKANAMEKAAQAGWKFGTFDELATSDKGASIITQAVDAIIHAQTKGQLGTSAKGLSKDVLKDAIRTGEWYKKNFAGFYASKLVEESKTKWLAKYGKKYAAPAAAIGGILALTYADMDRESDIDEFKHGISSRPGSSGKESWGAHKYIDREAHYSSHVFKAMAMGIAAPFGVLYATGLNQSMKDPKWFRESAKAKGVFGYAQDIVRTAGYGARRIESALPITRLFGVSAISDYALGSKRASNLNGKSEVFKIVKDGELQRFGLEFEQLLEETKKVNPDKYEQLREILKPQKLSRDLDKRVVRIQTQKGGGTKIYWDDTNRVSHEASTVGQKVAGAKGDMTVDLNLNIVKVRDKDPKLLSLAERQARKAALATDVFAKGTITNSLAYEAGREYVSQNIYKKGPFSNFLKNSHMPQGVMGNELLNRVWTAGEFVRYTLDIGSKGIGEGRDLFTPQATQMMSATNRIIQVRSHSKNPFGAESMKLSYNAYKHIARQTLVPVYGMNTFLERPFETMGLGDWAEKALGLRAGKLQESTSITRNIAGKALSFIHRPGLGLRIDAMKYGIPQYAAEFGIKRILPAYLGVQAFSLLDKGLGALTMSPTGKGPLTGIPIKAWETLALGYSKVSDMLGLTSVAKKQEEVAPGSTGIGFFAPAMSAYMAYRSANFLRLKGPEPVKKGITSLLEYAKKVPFIGEAMKAEKYLGATNKTPIAKYMAWAVKNPLMGLLSASLVPMAPFIPGLLGSNKTYQERKAEYKGEKEVAIRKYRGWLLSSSAYTGGKATQFRRHALNLVENNWQDQGVIYPSALKHTANNLTFGLFDRYMLEDYHAKSQPVYTSAPYGANVPLLGNIIAATIGRVIKPEVRYHDMNEESISGIGAIAGSGESTGGMGGDLATGSIVESGAVDIESPHSLKAHAIGLQQNFGEWAGLKGFIGSTVTQYMTGKQAPDEFTPYAQNATQMYNPANIMWGYQAGDVSIVGGEFLRRIFQRPQKTWEVNDIPNELYGVSWIPQQYDTKQKHRKDFTHGTTFDKIPQGWLYASRKGWDWLYGNETKGKDFEAFQAPVRTEILEKIAPHSREFREAANNTLNLALNNQLDPKREQRFYETLDQVRQLKEQIWASAQEYDYQVKTMDLSATVTDVDPETGTFKIQGSEERIYRIAGISTAIEDIRSRLLQKRAYNSAQQLDADAQRIQANIIEVIRKNIVQGQKIDMAVAQADQLQSNNGGVEAIIGSLNKELINAGAPYADTGSLSTHNIAQDRMGAGGVLASKYWKMLTSAETLANKKLISKRDYFSQYQTSQYFNKDVKLWSHPFKHIVEPFISSVAHNFGIDIMPSFTSERRSKQQYWDVIKYVKYKMLAVQATHDGDSEQAAFFQEKYKATMVGADPTDDTNRDELNALPLNERAYYDFFANEPDAKKRAKIYKFLPAPAKRLYTGIWAKRMAEGGDKDMQALFTQLQETGGYKLSEKEEKMYEDETGGAGDKAAWSRAHFVREYMEEHSLPGVDWSGWSPDVDLDDVQILALRDQGEQVQDYGFFDDKVRMASFNGTAFAAAMDMETTHHNTASVTGTIIPLLAESDSISSVSGMPTSSQFAMNNTDVMTNAYQKSVMKSGNAYMNILDDVFTTARGFF